MFYPFKVRLCKHERKMELERMKAERSWVPWNEYEICGHVAPQASWSDSFSFVAASPRPEVMWKRSCALWCAAHSFRLPNASSYDVLVAFVCCSHRRTLVHTWSLSTPLQAKADAWKVRKYFDAFVYVSRCKWIKTVSSTHFVPEFVGRCLRKK